MTASLLGAIAQSYVDQFVDTNTASMVLASSADAAAGAAANAVLTLAAAAIAVRAITANASLVLAANAVVTSVAATANASLTITAAATIARAAATSTASMSLAATGIGEALTAYSATVLADGPVIYLRLGESSGTVANDSSAGTHVNGTYRNSPALGQPGLIDADPNTAVQFTGTQDVLVTPTTKLNPPSTGYTVECWVKHLGATTGTQYLFRWLGANGLCAMNLNATGSILFTAMYSGSLSVQFSSPLINMRDGQPHHVVGVRDADNVYIYIDGILAVSGTRVGMNNSSGNNFTIGSDGSIPFGGTIDEFAFYPAALSATQIATHYTAGLGARSKPVWVVDVAASSQATTSSKVATVTTPINTGDVLVAVIERTGATVNSVAGCGATWTKAFGLSSGQAVDYWIGTGATAAGAVTATLSASVLGLINVLTIRNLTSAAVRAAHCDQGTIVSPGNPTVVGASDTSDAGCIVIATQVVNSASGTTLFSTLVPAFGWGTVGGSSAAQRWRTSQAVEAASTAIATTSTSAITYGLGQLVLGPASGAPLAATSTASMTLAASSTAFGPSSYPLAVLADSPAAYYRLDESSGSFADSSGNGRTATVTGTPTYLQPPAALIDGNSVTFSGTQYGDMGTTSFLNAPSALTVEAWVKFTSTATITIIGRDNSGGGTLRGWRLRAIAGSFNWLVFSNVSTTSATISSPLTYNDGNWHHVVATATNSGSMFLYVDGAQVATIAMAFSMAGTNINGEDTFIGASHSTAAWIGSLDEVAIYTSALSAARVAAHYAAG